MVRRSVRVEVPLEKERVFVQSGFSSATHSAYQIFAPKHPLRLNHAWRARLPEYKCVPSRDRAKRPARNLRAAERYKCRRRVFAVLRLDSHRDKEPACRLDWPSKHNSRSGNPSSDSGAMFDLAGMHVTNR